MADAIVTRSLTKFYGAQCVLNALDLRVPQGSTWRQDDGQEKSAAAGG
jgi:hypothetical protein